MDDFNAAIAVAVVASETETDFPRKKRSKWSKKLVSAAFKI